MVQGARAGPDGAQWTGITSRIGERLLETGAVDAVLTMAPDPEDRWRPMPVIVTKAEGMSFCRGMRMGYAPLLALLEPARERGFKRLAVIGIPCQVYALRVLEDTLSLETLCHRHTLLGQHHHRQVSRIPRTALRCAGHHTYPSSG